MPGLWDSSLYEGSADHYANGRLPYPQRLADMIQTELELAGTERLLDLGCGPGNLTLLLAPLFERALGVDPDADMLRVATRAAEQRGLLNIEWKHCYAEDLDDGLGPFDVVTLAQSFHWMDQRVVAGQMRRLLRPGGYCLHLGATTHEGNSSTAELRYPPPPRQALTELVQRYLGPKRRAGQGFNATPVNTEKQSLSGAGFSGPRVVTVPGGDRFTRSEDEVVASLFSLSSSAPHLFGTELGQFEHDLRRLLRSTSEAGLFSEVSNSMTLSIWSN
jgi:SAM-dependent methyltransferase